MTILNLDVALLCRIDDQRYELNHLNFAFWLTNNADLGRRSLPEIR